MKTWVRRRDGQGCCNNLVQELPAEDADGFGNFARLFNALFDTLVHLVSPLIVEQNKTTVPPSSGRETRSGPEIVGNKYVVLFFRLSAIGMNVGRFLYWMKQLSQIFDIVINQHIIDIAN